LKVQAIARGTVPDAELSPKALTGLQKDGLVPAESIPQKISLADLEFSTRVVAFCELPEELQGKCNVEHWDDIPPVSEDYDKARDAIVERLNRLIQLL
jgi:hypothetical protein